MKTLRSIILSILFVFFFTVWHQQALASVTLQASPDIELLCWSEAAEVTPTCTFLGPGPYNVMTEPVHGTLRFATEYQAYNDPKCGNINLPSNIAYYTWTDVPTNATEDFFSLRYWYSDGHYSDIDFVVTLSSSPLPTPTPTPTPIPIPPDSPSPEGNLGYETSSSTPNINCFDPVNIATGNNLQTETDFVGASNTFLELTRTYNSQSTASSAFGANWNSTWHRSLTQQDSAIKATRADGGVVTFTLNNGVWQSGPNVTSKLSSIFNSSNQQTGWQLVTADDSSEYYLLDGRFDHLVSRAGLVTTINYDSNKKLSSVVGPFGHTLNFTYDNSNRVNQVKTPDGSSYFYKYDGNNNLVSVTYPDNTVRKYLYENASSPHAMTGIVEDNENRFATFIYDAQGRTISTEHSNGAERVTITYNSDGTSTMTDANGHSRIATFITQFGMVKPAAMDNKCSCGSSAYTYDSYGFLESQTDFNGNTTKYVHDSRGLEISRTEADGTPQARTITTTWHQTFHLPTKITEPNRVTDFDYDEKGNMKKKTVTANNKSRTWQYFYNNSGQVTNIDGPRTDVQDGTTFTYDSKGNMTSIKNALGHVSNITSYDANGRPLTIKDPNGLVTNSSYDFRGHLTSQNSGGEVTTYSYNTLGQLAKITKPDESYIYLDYDAAHRLTDIVDGLGNHIYYALDAVGNRLRKDVFDTNNQLTQTRSYKYDPLNRMAQSIGAQEQTTIYGYDNNGNLTSVIDPLNNTTNYAYDALNRLAQATDPNKGVTKTNHDLSDMITSITDPLNNTTNYTYDGLNDITSIQSHDSGITTKTYDEAGNLASTTDARGKTISYTYDALNRLTGQYSSDGKSVALIYDQSTNGIGHLTSMTDDSGSTTWTYDIHGRVTQKQQKTGSATLTTNTTYYPSGNVANVTYPSGRKLTYWYEWLSGKIAKIDVDGQPFLNSIKHQPFGPPWLWTYANTSLTGGRLFDLDGNIYIYGYYNQITLEYSSLTRDNAGRITSSTDYPSLAKKTFGYDVLNRLTGYTNGAQLHNYGYDPNGNRTSLDTNTGSIDYFYNTASNQLLSHSGATPRNYTYDAAGNLINDSVFTYAYDASERLIQASKGTETCNDLSCLLSGGTCVNGVCVVTPTSKPTPNSTSPPNSIQYQYNGIGQRVAKIGSGISTGATVFSYDPSGNLMGEYDATGNAFIETIWLEGMPVGVLAAGTQFYVIPDHLGAPYAATDTSGNKVWAWNHDPFGNGAAPVYNLRFPGQYFDNETGLHYNMARTYDPTTGRYLQSDPIGLAGGVNTYAYVGNNPIMGVDPLGLLSLSEANKHWKEGDGEPLSVDICTLDLSNVSDLPKTGQVNFAGKNFSSINDALVYGTVTLKPGPDNTVVGGFDYYNFDIKPWSVETFVRNVETIIGRLYAGSGTPYPIKFTGTASLGGICEKQQ